MHYKLRQTGTGLLLTALLFSGATAALIMFSAFGLSLSDLSGTFSHSNEGMAQAVITELRLPRMLICLLCGAGLAVAGCLMQALTRNPLASPALLGINAGAACTVTLASLTGLVAENNPLIAMTGAAASGLLVLLLGGFFSHRPNPLRLVLAGIAMTALLTSLTRAALILADERARSLLHWLNGSVANTGWEQVHQLWPLIFAGLLLALTQAPALNLLALGDNSARSLGMNLRRLRLLSALAVILLSGASVTIAGPVAFIGLLVPHICRSLFGHDHKILLPTAALGGAALMVWADTLARGIAFPAETPVGIVTALLGTPFFILLAIRSRL